MKSKTKDTSKELTNIKNIYSDTLFTINNYAIKMIKLYNVEQVMTLF